MCLILSFKSMYCVVTVSTIGDTDGTLNRQNFVGRYVWMIFVEKSWYTYLAKRLFGYQIIYIYMYPPLSPQKQCLTFPWPPSYCSCFIYQWISSVILYICLKIIKSMLNWHLDVNQSLQILFLNGIFCETFLRCMCVKIQFLYFYDIPWPLLYKFMLKTLGNIPELWCHVIESNFLLTVSI